MNQVCNAVKQIDAWLTERRQHVNHRDCLWLQGSEAWTSAMAEHIISTLSSEHQRISWIGSRSTGEESQSAQTSKLLLGTECAHAVYNCFSQFDLNTLLRVTGTIQRGGLLILLTPNSLEWPFRCQCLPLQSHGFEHTGGSDFIRYLCNHLDNHPFVLKLSATQHSLKTSAISDNHKILLTNARAPHGNSELTEEQQAVRQSIRASFRADSKVAAILTAKRGRGKSWLLGWMINEYLRDGYAVALVAPQAKSTNQVLTHIAKKQHQSLFRYSAPDDPRLRSDTFDIVVVDEAASIPTTILKTIISNQRHCIFSTTTGGYEGSASGFQHRFIPFLVAHKAINTEQYTLESPLRWFAGDHLEHWLDSLLTATKDDNRTLDTAYNDVSLGETLQCETVTSRQLADNPAFASAVFSLLADAHYQTTPNDFVRLLDAQDSTLFVLSTQHSLLGAAIGVVEGGFEDRDLTQKMCSGQRRVKGHMTPQYLSFHTTNSEFCQMRYLRINRIAIDIRHQGKGLGSLFLEDIKRHAEKHAVDVLSSFFGATPRLENFWQNNGFSAYRTGKKTDKASGQQSALYLLPLTAKAKKTVADNRVPSKSQQSRKIAYFINGHRNLASIRNDLSIIDLPLTNATDCLPTRVLHYVKNHPDVSENRIVETFALAGKKHLSVLLRQALVEHNTKKTPL